MSHFVFFLCVVGLLSTTLQLVLGTGILGATVHFVSVEDAGDGNATKNPSSKFWINERVGVRLLQGTITELMPGIRFPIAKSSLEKLGEHCKEIRDGLTGLFTRSSYDKTLKNMGISRKHAEYSVTYVVLANTALIILEAQVEEQDGGSEVLYYHVQVVPQLEEYDNPLKKDKDLRQNVQFKVGEPFSASPPKTLRIEINPSNTTKPDQMQEPNKRRIGQGIQRPLLRGVKVELRNVAGGVICPGLTLFAYILNMEQLAEALAAVTSKFSKEVTVLFELRHAVGGPRKLVGFSEKLQYWLKVLYATKDGNKLGVFIDQLKVW